MNPWIKKELEEIENRLYAAKREYDVALFLRAKIRLLAWLDLLKNLSPPVTCGDLVRFKDKESRDETFEWQGVTIRAEDLYCEPETSYYPLTPKGKPSKYRHRLPYTHFMAGTLTKVPKEPT